MIAIMSTPSTAPRDCRSALPAALAAAGRALALRRGELVFRRDTRPRHAYFVESGEVHLVRGSPGGAEVVLHRATSGLLAEASLDSAAYHCDAVAAGPARLLQLPIDAFRAALESDPAFQRAYRMDLARSLRQARARCERMALKRIDERIVHFLESEGVGGRITLGRTRKAWAAELGVTHEALYRALHRMRDDGRIAIEGASVALRARRLHPATPSRGAANPRARAGR